MDGGVKRLYDDMLADCASSDERPQRAKRKEAKAKVSDVYVEEKKDKHDTKLLHHGTGTLVLGVMKYNKLSPLVASEGDGDKISDQTSFLLGGEKDKVLRLLQVRFYPNNTM